MNPDENALRHAIDLHGQYKKQAVEIVRSKIDEVTELLQEDVLEPNSGDGLNHIFKIICGPGNNSKNGA